MKYFVVIFWAALNLAAQTNPPAATNAAVRNPADVRPFTRNQRQEQIRADCIQHRRVICGKILKVLPDGLVVDSGYTDLLRAPLNHAWLIPGSASASRDVNQIESREPGSACIGIIFLTDTPKSRGATPKPKPYDYVTLLGYPAGQHTYASVGDIKKTVRRFSADLPTAVNLNYAAAEATAPPPSPK